ncbi:uracil-DNA glycosylase-like protein [Halteromyces radiatus]|uniref:uracil-DNA glycosylase-like protein n=1 Tax=Halteromyces radiatus TaxID=101107 RepID=UPI00221EFF4E|nr:uracil-DNA glycosylase-like protein [Halteromyces radiatus]KAI8081288.1 uracil-DNA glycosylase-like protein [Halteromyces radiatus]
MPKSPYFKQSTTTKIKVNNNDPLKKTIPDYLDYDLRVLFIGINPGITSAARGHHFAGPTNHFWPCLSESGLVDRVLTCKDDVTMTAEFNLGITNLSARTTRRASDLTLAEQRENAPLLTEKISKYRPRVACFVGKGIYEIYLGKTKGIKMGLQPNTIPWSNGKGATKLFVMPSTSGIVSAYQKKDKLEFFQQLCILVNQEN